MIPKIFLLFLSYSLSQLVYGQTISDENTLSSAFSQLNDNPVTISFSNDLKFDPVGGHLQGVQGLLHNKKNYLILSGSSASYSYYAIVKTGDNNRVVSINKILDKPYKHAGGFQMHHDLMAIGVEDNEEKNKSRVFIFHLENPEHPPENPLAIIDRLGTFKRATAGCVGITIIQNKVLVVVGDWDTEHLDFYRIDEDKLYEEGATLELEYTINSKKIDKSTWIDEHWLSYQNINLLQDLSGNLFLAGMASNDQDENVLDLFEIDSPDLSTFQLQKIYSRTFPKNEHTKFRWGAGIQFDQKNKLTLITCGENIASQSIIHVYQAD